MVRWWEWLLLAVAVALFLAQLLVASPQKSAAFDEQYHLAAGYSYLRTGDPRLATTHPPLMGLIAALALWNRGDIALPLDHPAWAAGDRFLFSDAFLWEANSDPQGMLASARKPIMAVGVLLLLVLFFWARQLVGPFPAWGVLILAIFDPNLLGNARVVTTDIGLTTFFFLAMWRFWCWLERPNAPNLVLTGLCTGLAICAKYTGLFVGPALLLVAILYPRRPIDDSLGQRLLGLVGIGLAALVVVWALFRFEFGPMPNGPLRLPMPAPYYWQQFYNTFFRIINLQGDRYDFFWGEASKQGWWYYFPVALAVKTPIPLLLLGSAGLLIALSRGGWRRTSPLWVTPALFLMLGLTGVLTIGYRHILPVVPFLMLWAGYAISDWSTQATFQPARRRLAVAVAAMFILWQVAGSLRLFPHQESFFNELAGDWYNWSNLLVDSNLDWGQDLPTLAQVMSERDIDTVNLAYFGKAVPEMYGVRYRPLYGYLRFVEGDELSAYNPFTPEPGWYAISATSLRLGLHQADTLDLYAYFRTRRPDARAGYSIYLYHLTDSPALAVARRTVVGEPVYRLDPAALGVQPGTRVQVKWLQTPEVAFYPLGEGFTPPVDEGYQSVRANYGDVMTLLGYDIQPDAVTPGQSLRLLLYWQVGSAPMPTPAPTRGAPLAVFVHLTAPDDPQAKIAQFDGWPTALRGLEPGDIIGQPVELTVAPDATLGVYDLLAGLYSPQNFVRLTVASEGEAVDFVRLGQVAVE
jgi:4-amino-4-deoxy-L-arabinose transferase-like glycosyltransferase